MNIIQSFLNPNNEYTFTKMDGDASTKKKFYNVFNNDEMLNYVLIQIDTTVDNFDEYFEETNIGLSQYDYFKHTFQLLHPSYIYACSDEHGIILMKYISNTTLKEYLKKDTTIQENIYYRIIDLLLKVQNIKLDENDIIKKRSYNKNSLLKEVQQFLNVITMDNTDKNYIKTQLTLLVNDIDKLDVVLCHRDFQTKNIMYDAVNDTLHLIDMQDMCMGNYLQDLVCLLYESSVILSDESRYKYAHYFYIKKHINEPFEHFYKKIQLLGLFRILKSYGTHLNYFVNNNRWSSFNLLENNRILLDTIKYTFPNIINVINKYRFSGIILAAGRGKRMEGTDDIPKALCEINGISMLHIILDKMVKLHPDQIIIVVGYKKEQIYLSLLNYPYKNIKFVEQKELCGTGHAVLQTQELLHDYKYNLMVHFGDNPTIKYNTLVNILIYHTINNNYATLGTSKSEMSHTKSGRIIRKENKITEIYEDANENYVSDEFLGGIQIYKSVKLFDYFGQIKNNNRQGEYYLTDIVKIITDDNNCVESFVINRDELLNVNTKTELMQCIQMSL